MPNWCENRVTFHLNDTEENNEECDIVEYEDYHERITNQ